MEIKGHKVYAHQFLVESAFNLKMDTISMEHLFIRLIRMATQNFQYYVFDKDFIIM